MKKLSQFSIMILTIFLSVAFTACSSVPPEVETAEFEELLTFGKLILGSNAAVVGEYIETIEHENYIEQKFKVKECLYGDVTDSEIHLYSNIGTKLIIAMSLVLMSTQKVSKFF